MSTNNASDEPPPDRMIDLSRAMLEALEQHPDDGIRVHAVICLYDPVTKEAGTATHLTETPREAVNMMLAHADALAKDYGMIIAPAPTDPEVPGEEEP